MIKQKQCFKCGEIKPLAAFYKHPQMADGRVNKCKECNKQDVKKNRLDKIDYYKEYDKKRSMLLNRVEARKRYALSEAGKQAFKKARNKWIKNNPIKRGANCLVNKAVKDGRLSKPNLCESCGSKSKRIHGHHDDYAKPLEVRWLCPGCHAEWHKKNGEALNG